MEMEMEVAQVASQKLYKYFAGDAQIILIFSFYLIFALALLSFVFVLTSRCLVEHNYCFSAFSFFLLQSAIPNTLALSYAPLSHAQRRRDRRTTRTQEETIEGDRCVQQKPKNWTRLAATTKCVVSAVAAQSWREREQQLFALGCMCSVHYTLYFV